MKLPSGHPRGFTLLEVMIALGIFFMVMFAILELVTQNLRAAQAIKPDQVDVASVVADLMLTNRVYEGSETGDFGEVYPDYAWSRDISMVSTNGLYQVDVIILKNGVSIGSHSQMSLLLFRPDSTRGGPGQPPGPGSGPGRTPR
jgi:type II secretion system protein I